jgi:NAD(P)-dependent dehydrogenase (short-subunit alcohol dehydrogenase family)
MSHYGRLDILINNIGFAHYGKAEAVPLDDWHEAFRINLTTALLCCRHCIPKMRDGGGGAIVNFSSSAAGLGLISQHGGVAYVTTKAGMHGLTLSIAADYAADGIRCNCVIVGPVNTPMVAHLGPEALERRRHVVPLKAEGTGWDIAYAALYLASDEARWVTGVFLPVDGGFLAIRDWPR